MISSSCWLRSPAERRRPALTLVELLVVLVILAVLTTMAVSLTDSTIEQARFDATQKTLDAIQTALLGTGNPADPLTGFVADMGGLPKKLDDLANPYLNAPKYANQSPVGMPAIYGGWRGPYVQVAPQTDEVGNQKYELRDGWGESIFVAQGAGPIIKSGMDLISMPTPPTPPPETLFPLRIIWPGKPSSSYTSEVAKAIDKNKLFGHLRVNITRPTGASSNDDAFAPSAAKVNYYDGILGNHVPRLPSLVQATPASSMFEFDGIPIGYRMLLITLTKISDSTSTDYPYPIRVTGGLQDINITLELRQPPASMNQ